MTYLVDTDCVVDYLKGYQKATQVLTPLLSEGISISIITFGEIYEGIYYGHKREQHEQGFRLFVSTISILTITQTVAKKFAQVRGDLRKRGLLISDPDIYIAATAIQHNLTLITRNLKDYQRIPDLDIYQQVPEIKSH